MTNKEKLRNAIEQDINNNNHYDEIIKKIEGTKKMNKKNNILYKWAIVPVCLALAIVISGVIFLNYQNNIALKKENNVEKKNNITLNINYLTDLTSSLKLDANVKNVTNNDVNFPLPYKDNISLNIPKDLDKTEKSLFYIRENIESKKYNILFNYRISYYNENDRLINISYSQEHKPLRDYYFDDDGSKITTINGISLKIYQYENTYYTEFKYNEYNFDIETSKITEEELTALLVSLLK